MSSNSFFKPQIISLYRNLLRESNKIQNYNFRSHMKRHVAYNFNKLKNSTSSSPAEQNEKLSQFLNDGKKELEQIKRIALINGLYPSEIPSVIEIAIQNKKLHKHD